VIALGLYSAAFFMLNDVVPHNTASPAWMLIVGATCSTLNVMLLFSAIRAVLWDRRMMGQAKQRRRMSERDSSRLEVL